MRILIVEDERRLAGFLRQGLEENGYAVDVAHDGDSAFELASEIDYDVVILDLMLPAMDGQTVCRELRRRGRRTAILILSAKSSVEDRVTSLDVGADDYLSKPFSFQELLARVRALLRRSSSPPAPTVLTVGDLALNTATRAVTLGGTTINLSAREFAVLEYLMRNAGVVVTQSMIIDHIWNMDYEGGSNIVEVYVNHLRRKIEHGSRQKLIHTVRGAGYVLRSP